MGHDVSHLEQLFHQSEQKRNNWDTHWQIIKDISWEAGGDFTRDRENGHNVAQDIFDPTAALGLQKFSSVMEALLTPRHSKWHGMEPSHPSLKKSQRVNEYLDQVTNIMFRFRRFPESGFSSNMHIGYKSLGAFGNTCINTMPRSNGGISYRHAPIGAIWIEEDDRGYVDTIFYRWKMTNHAAMLKWGDLAPESVKKALEDGGGSSKYKEQEYLHVVMPRENREVGRPGPEGMKLESWEISLKDHEFIKIKNPLTGELSDSGGFNTIPYIYSRYVVDPSEVYGRGPLGLVLPASQTLQEQERTMLIAGQMAVEPVILAQDDSLMNTVDVDGFSLVSGTVVAGGLDERGNARFKAFDNGYNHPLIKDMMDGKREQINDALLIQLFQILVDNPQMTATEVMVRAQEKGQLITPMVGRQHDECLGKLIERDLDILNEQGLLPPMPQELVEANAEFDIVYQSAATKIQAEEEIQSVRASIEEVIPLIELDPSVRHLIDFTAMARHLAEKRGVPAKLLRSEEDVRRMVAQEQAQIQREQVLANVPGMAKATKDLSDAGQLQGGGV